MTHYLNDAAKLLDQLLTLREKGGMGGWNDGLV
jgi:hypothetical protein